MSSASVYPVIVSKHYTDDEDHLLYEVLAVSLLKDRKLVADVAKAGTMATPRAPIHTVDVMRMAEAMQVLLHNTDSLTMAIVM